MFIILLKFSNNKACASEYISGHNDWLKQGFEEGIFLLAGSLQPALGGSVIAHNTSRSALEKYVKSDPFVENGVVSAEILQIDPKKVDDRLGFLIE